MSLFNRGFLLLTVAGLVTLTGCMPNRFNTSIIPLGDDKYDMVSTAATEDVAYKNAEVDAKKKCKNIGKTFYASSHESVYQGVDKKAKQDVGVADVAMAWVTGSSHKEDRSDDYKVTMRFECK